MCSAVKKMATCAFAALLTGCGAVSGAEFNVIHFGAGTHVLTETFVISKSNTVIEGDGPATVIMFQPDLQQVQCQNDRAFTTSCEVQWPTPGVPRPRRQISQAIAVGDRSFVATDDVSDLLAGDWLIIQERELKASEVVAVDWAQVTAVSGHTVTVQEPFRTAFSADRIWEPVFGGLGFYKVPHLVENVTFRNFTLVVAAPGTPGISVFAAQHVTIENVAVHTVSGQALYSYLSKDVTIQDSSADSGASLSEFAATVDLVLTRNTFQSSDGVGFGLDYGTAFFRAANNSVPHGSDVGIYLLYGVHDGQLTDSRVSFVDSPNNAIGILLRGTQRVVVQNNYLAGGAGHSIGVSIGPQFVLELPSIGNTVTPNRFGSQWSLDYDPTNVP